MHEFIILLLSPIVHQYTCIVATTFADHWSPRIASMFDRTNLLIFRMLLHILDPRIEPQSSDTYKDKKYATILC